MPDAESFVAAIAANPADDLPRLVFADWLDENGDPARAAFIRDHVQLAKTRPGTDEFQTLFRKCADTLKANLPAWIKPACDAFGQPAVWTPGKAVGGWFPISVMRPDDPVGLRSVDFSRGFIGSVSLTLIPGTPVRGVDELLRLHPVSDLALRSIIDTENWSRVVTDRMRNIPTLRLLGVSSGIVTGRIFTSDVFAGVTRLTALMAREIDVLCRSRMAKQLTALTVAGFPGVIAALAEFPLDDKLQEFGIAPPGRDTPAVADWSAVSRVSFRPTLKRLDLTRCGMTDDGLAAFARGEEWVRLQGLKLGGNLFGDRGWADFCRGWRTPELTYLDASRNRLTDAGAEMLARSGMLKTLRVIDLRGNRIAGRGAVALARAVAEGKVNKLLLAGNPVGKRETATVKGLLGERVDLA